MSPSPNSYYITYYTGGASVLKHFINFIYLSSMYAQCTYLPHNAIMNKYNQTVCL